MSTDPQDPQAGAGQPQQPDPTPGQAPQQGVPATAGGSQQQNPYAQQPPNPQDGQPHNPYANRPSTPGDTGTPSRPLSPTEERNFALFAHLVAGVALVLTSGTLGWAAALTFYLVFQERGPFVRHHAANALNVQIIVGIVLLISIPLIVLLGLGLLTGFLAIVFGVILSIMGAIKANNGEWWTPPATPQFVK